MSPLPDHETCYRAVTSRDSRFDGWFVTAVTSTRIYCRPSCPAITPKRQNVRFFSTAAAAQAAGFRACLRCRPDAAPGSPEWNQRSDVVARAMRLIADGVVDREGVAGLARRLGYSERHLNRQLVDELGTGPLALARAQRAQTARLLIETTNMPFTDVAFAAGFASIRQFNDTVREIYAKTPSELRVRRRRQGGAIDVTSSSGMLTLRLPYRAPFDANSLWAFLANRTIPAVEEIHDQRYRRSLQLPNGVGLVELTPAAGYVQCALQITDLRDVTSAVQRCRRLLDLDADPRAVDAVLATDPRLAEAVAAHPGMRLPGCVDATELAVRAVIGQQISVASARRVAGRLTETHGKPLTQPTGGITHLFPSAASLAEADASTLPMPVRRQHTLRTLCTALADGTLTLDAGSDPIVVQEALRKLPGIGPWTAQYIALRGLSTPDVFLADDLGVRRGAQALGLPENSGDLAAHAERRWRPFRSYAVLHLWNAS